MRVGRSVKVHGRVQGVFFRAWAAEQAYELGITGWVRNCPDGSVEAHIAGEEQAVAKMIEQLRQGPPSAMVDRLDADEVPPEDSTTFEVRH